MYPPPPLDPWYLALSNWFYGLAVLSVSLMIIVLIEWRKKEIRKLKRNFIAFNLLSQ